MMLFEEPMNITKTELSPDVIGVELNPRITGVEAYSDYSLILTFENGERRRFDMTPYVGRSSWFEELRDLNYFSKAKPEYGTVVWPNGQDLCPDTFYLDSEPIE